MSRRRLAHRAAVVEAAVLLTVAKVAVAVVPFRLLRRVLGQHSPAGDETFGPLPPAAWRCGRAVEAAARRLPFATACLPRAIAGQLMLRRRGLAGTVVFGLARQDGALLNHAWLEHEGAAVLGHQHDVAYARTVELRAGGLR
ncbi:MAG TPA: lasso peptide biosynthesis B2 protein [Acidimicrobiales bacterium]|nr:lasso peptide biosynthesis B2 protein [Acidimicrobiales bacterium]